MNAQTPNYLEEWTVLDIMERDVVTVPRSLPVSELASLLIERGITGAPVVDDGGTVVGVVSQSDLVRALSGLALATVRGEGTGGTPELEMTEDEEGGVSAFFRRTNGDLHGGPLAMALLPAEELATRTVGDLMMPARFSVRSTTSLAGLARYLVTAKLHRALVMDGTKLLGIVTTFDILRAIAAKDVAQEPLGAASGSGG